MFPTAAIEKVVARCLGRKPKTADNLAKGVAAEQGAIIAARSKIDVAQLARKAAIEEFDAVGHKKADEDIAEAEREIERREHAVEALKVAHAERLDVETREQFHRDYEAERKAATELEKDLAKYAEAAKTIANFCLAGVAAAARRDALLERAKELREEVENYSITAESLCLAVGNIPYGDRPGLIYAGQQLRDQLEFNSRLRSSVI